MCGKYKKEDLRIIKTHKALISAMTQGLELRNFNQITVQYICEMAQISRATFYAHFADKYDLLRYWLRITQEAITKSAANYDELEQHFNAYVAEHQRTIRNLLEDANPETGELLREFISSLLTTEEEKSASQKTEAQLVLNKFCAGGIYNYLLWQVNSRFSPSIPVMNVHLHQIITALRQG